jgi:hypothetical protein
MIRLVAHLPSIRDLACPIGDVFYNLLVCDELVVNIGRAGRSCLPEFQIGVEAHFEQLANPGKRNRLIARNLITRSPVPTRSPSSKSSEVPSDLVFGRI